MIRSIRRNKRKNVIIKIHINVSKLSSLSEGSFMIGISHYLYIDKNNFA